MPYQCTTCISHIQRSHPTPKRLTRTHTFSASTPFVQTTPQSSSPVASKTADPSLQKQPYHYLVA
ncbi:hypothetical protein PAXRUDRAFT_831922, partial [Paxillus rubicundulus Ve08.2h10]